MNNQWSVMEVEPDRVLPLRALVLRPGWGSEMCVMDADRAEGTFHLAAVRHADDGILAVMTVMLDAVPETGGLTPGPGWRIRGMASHPDARGAGCAKALVVRGVERMWETRRDTVWCNARRVAYGFYEKLGFERFGGEFDIEGIGPHTVMARHP